MRTKFILIVASFFIISCDKKGIGDLTTYDADGNMHVVIAYGAGTLKPFEYDLEAKGFKNKIQNGEERLINYLPPPFNFGVIPSTNKNSNKLVETLVLSGSFSTGTLLTCKVIGGLEVKKNNSKAIIAISIPTDQNIKTISAKDLKELNAKYQNSLELIKLWLSSTGTSILKEIDRNKTISYIKSKSIR